MAVKKRQFTVTPHRPWRHGLVALVALSLLALAGWLLFERGRVQAGYDQQGWLGLERALREEIHELEGRNADLVRQNAILQRSSDIDRNAYGELQKTLADTQTEMLRLREQLSFYRGLVTPSDKSTGLHVERLVLEPGAVPNSFDYLLTLVQVRKNDRLASGEVDLRVVGALGDEAVSYSADELSSGEKPDRKFKFRYFQNFEGTLVLPAGFAPQSIEVDATPTGKRLKPVSKRFEWKSLMSGGS